MKIISDFHLHSKHSRATSKNLDLKNLERYGKIKGVHLIGTGDFTHPIWFEEIKKELTEDGTGILKSKTGFPFILSSEISLIYTQDGRGRKIHNVVLAPSLEVVSQITEYLKKHGRVDYDGRPIFKIPCPDFTYELKKISKDIEVIPAHIWTPWFSLFGSNSGFNTVEECFRDQTKNIHAMETGLSSDPAMNWRLSQLDRYTLVSNSDSHSFWPWRLGREANIMDLKKLTYDNFIKALRTKEGFVETVEVDPSFGKYHFTGHRMCNVCLDPKESVKLKDVCPKCGRKLTVGVLQRVEELADREPGFKPKHAIPFKSLIPLSEILAVMLGKAVATQAVWKEYHNLVTKERSEFDVLLDLSLEELKKLTTEKIAEAIIKNREGKIEIKPGYDGVYGVPILDKSQESAEEKKVITKAVHRQKGLDEFC